MPKVNLSYLVPICLVATLGGLLFGYDTGVIAGAIEPLTARFDLSPAMKGWASGCVLLGCGFGVLLVGPISDRLGRKLALFLAAQMFLISALGTAFPNNVWIFILFRVIGGVGIGIASISTPMYIAEITPAHLRGRMVAVNQIAIAGGIAATAFINYFISHAHGDPQSPEVQQWLVASGWRWMFAAGSIPAAVFLLLLIPIPESPRWLAEMGREERARQVLSRVGGAAFAQTEMEGIRAALATEKGTWADVFSRRMLVPLLLGIALAVLQQVTGINVFLYFGATIFKTMTASTRYDAGLVQEIVITGTGMVFTLIAIATVDKWGRRPLMLAGTLGMGLSLLAMGWLAPLMGGASAAAPASALSFLGASVSPAGAMLAAIVAYIACFGLSVGPVVWVILAEIYPTTVRGRASGIATFFLWMADFAVTQTFPIMDDKNSWFVAHFHHAFPFYVYAAFCAMLIGLVWFTVPETKGRSLEEIEKYWT